MNRLMNVILRWSVTEIVTVSLIGHFVDPAAIYPASWVFYSLAGREAARRGRTWHGVVAGSAVTIAENLVWLAQGAPGHADTSDLPRAIAALTYFTLILGMAVIGAAFGALGAVFGRRARRRSERIVRPTSSDVPPFHPPTTRDPSGQPPSPE